MALWSAMERYERILVDGRWLRFELNVEREGEP